MSTSLDKTFMTEASAALREANLAFAGSHPGESAGRQPVHTVYGGAQLFAADSVPKLGAIALRAMDQYAADATTLARAVGISDHPALATIDQRVREKLRRDPIEDFRIDFEDGYGNRPDADDSTIRYMHRRRAYSVRRDHAPSANDEIHYLMAAIGRFGSAGLGPEAAQ